MAVRDVDAAAGAIGRDRRVWCDPVRAGPRAN